MVVTSHVFPESDDIKFFYQVTYRLLAAIWCLKW